MEFTDIPVWQRLPQADWLRRWRQGRAILRRSRSSQRISDSDSDSSDVGFDCCNSAESSIAKGTSEQFTATGTYTDNSTQNLTGSVTWTSQTTSVATITAGGLVTAAGIGTSNIKAASGAINGSATLTVTAATLVSIAVTAPSLSIAKGTSEQFTATGTFSDGSMQNLTSSVTWSSQTTSVATVTSGGMVTAVGSGTSNIQAASGAMNGSATLTVTAADAGFDCGDASEPNHRDDRHGAIHSYRHLHGQQHAKSDHHRYLEFQQHGDCDYQQYSRDKWLGQRGGKRDHYDSGDVGICARLDAADGDCGFASSDRGEPAESYRFPTMERRRRSPLPAITATGRRKI